MRLFTAPQQIQIDRDRKSIFLAGTIDIGSSEDWQQKIIDSLADKDVDIYNPRRKEWDSSWEQNIENPQFYQQVSWEISAMEKADVILMNFLPNSQSPITLLELGLHATDGHRLLVCCPDKFWRSGNVQIVCNKYGISLYKNIDDLFEKLLKIIE